MISQQKTRPYLQCVPLIDSQCQSQRSQYISNSNFYRSPLRDRQNKMNISNTPLRVGKTSLSPLRMRKVNQQGNQQGNLNNQSNLYNQSNLTNQSNQFNTSVRANFSKRRNNQKQEESCFNHPQKYAKFYVQAPQETMYCCQKCAILLASQGFKVCKMDNLIEQSTIKKQNPRKIQIQNFINRLDSVTSRLKSTQTNFDEKFLQGQAQLEEELSRIQEYYDQFYQILNEHKKRVITQVRQEFQKSNSPVIDQKKQIKGAIGQALQMKRDIMDSWQDIILVAQQHQYRPVLQSYTQKLQSFVSLLSLSTPELTIRHLSFKNTLHACNALQKGLQVQWNDQSMGDEGQSNQLGNYSKQSQAENPVELLEKEDKFIKSSLKGLDGLFSSFDQ